MIHKELFTIFCEKDKDHNVKKIKNLKKNNFKCNICNSSLYFTCLICFSTLKLYNGAFGKHIRRDKNCIKLQNLKSNEDDIQESIKVNRKRKLVKENIDNELRSPNNKKRRRKNDQIRNEFEFNKKMKVISNFENSDRLLSNFLKSTNCRELFPESYKILKNKELFYKNGVELINESRSFKGPLINKLTKNIPVSTIIKDINVKKSFIYDSKKNDKNAKRLLQKYKGEEKVKRRVIRKVDEEKFLQIMKDPTKVYTPSGSNYETYYNRYAEKKDYIKSVQEDIKKSFEKGEVSRTIGINKILDYMKLLKIKNAQAGDAFFRCVPCFEYPLQKKKMAEFEKKENITNEEKEEKDKLQKIIEKTEYHKKIQNNIRKKYNDVLKKIIDEKDSETVRITQDFVKYYISQSKCLSLEVNSNIILMEYFDLENDNLAREWHSFLCGTLSNNEEKENKNDSYFTKQSWDSFIEITQIQNCFKNIFSFQDGAGKHYKNRKIKGYFSGLKNSIFRNNVLMEFHFASDHGASSIDGFGGRASKIKNNAQKNRTGTYKKIENTQDFGDLLFEKLNIKNNDTNIHIFPKINKDYVLDSDKIKNIRQYHKFEYLNNFIIKLFPFEGCDADLVKTINLEPKNQNDEFEDDFSEYEDDDDYFDE